MHISCPSCGSTYDVPAIMLTAARAMRCAACGHGWHTEPIDLETAQADMRRQSQPATPAVQAPAELAEDVAQDMLSPLLPPLDAGTSATIGLHATDIGEAGSAGSESSGVVAAGTVELVDEKRAALSIPPARSSVSGRLPALAGWVISLAVLAASTHAAITHRATVVGAWPNALRLYQWFGLG